MIDFICKKPGSKIEFKLSVLQNVFLTEAKIKKKMISLFKCKEMYLF